MSDFATTLKQACKRGAKMISRGAKRLASATKFKASEFNDLKKRRKLIRELGEITYKLSSEGLVLPVEAAKVAGDIALLDNDINVLRTDHAAKKAAAAQIRAAEKAERAAEKAAAKTAAAIEKSTAPVQIDIPDDDFIVTDSAPETETPVIEIEPEEEATTADAEIPTLNV